MLLFDEPLSNLDAKLRGDMRIELRELQHRLGVTSLYVTHDLEEALAMSDNIIVMRSGNIEQIRPAGGNLQLSADRVRGGFCRLRQSHQRAHRAPDLASNGSIAVESNNGSIVYGTTHGRARGCAVPIGARGAFSLHSERPAGDRNIWPVSVHRSIFLGDLTQVHVSGATVELIVRQTGMKPWVDGQPAYLSADPRHCVLLESI